MKAEPMEVDPPLAELPPPASHLLAFSTLGASEKSEPMSNLPETLARPQKDLFSQDISVKMASELLFKLSGTSPSSSLPPAVLRVNLGKFLILHHKSHTFSFTFSGVCGVKSRIHRMERHRAFYLRGHESDSDAADSWRCCLIKKEKRRPPTLWFYPD